MESQVLHSVWCNVGEAAGENWKLITFWSERANGRTRKQGADPTFYLFSRYKNCNTSFLSFFLFLFFSTQTNAKEKSRVRTVETTSAPPPPPPLSFGSSSRRVVGHEARGVWSSLLELCYRSRHRHKHRSEGDARSEASSRYNRQYSDHGGT